MKTFTTLNIVAAAIAVAALAGCSNDPTLNNNGNTTGTNITFNQIDRIGKPGIKEVFLPYAQHDPYDHANPQGDVATYGPALGTFVTGTAGRSAAVSSYVTTVLLPDALVANLTVTASPASYLGWETGGRLASNCKGTPPGSFGGRDPLDDVVDVTLGLAFGNLATTAYPAATAGTPGLTGLTPAADDGAEQNGTNGRPQLASDNVSCGTKTVVTTRFPYLQDPI